MTENIWPIVELRQYTLHPGTRDVMIELFDRELVETQEAVGMRIVAQFRDEGDPDRFVWMRAFPDLGTRGDALTAFYIDGEVWRTHAPAARATMVDTTNALLLQPASSESGFVVSGERPGLDATELPESRVLATIYYLDTPTEEFVEFFDSRVRPLHARTGAAPIACYVTDPSPNTFAPLPIRSETVFVCFSLFENAEQRGEHLDRLAADSAWTEEVRPELSKRLSAPVEQLLLAPTARSMLR